MMAIAITIVIFVTVSLLPFLNLYISRYLDSSSFPPFYCFRVVVGMKNPKIFVRIRKKDAP